VRGRPPAASLDVGIAALGKVSPEVKVTDSGTGEIAFTGPVPPVFVGDDEQAMIAVEESAMPGVSA
jgi:hypothetical protein